MKKSEIFEKQITRIHQLLEGSNSGVTWNDKIPDPDNIEQLRQIDFTIRNQDTFTIGECRFRKAAEDVQWIEELIGRKNSLQADSVIAVSSSGFTKGAILKAQAYGIILRNFFEISEQELESWGKKTLVDVIFVSFEYLKLSYPPTSEKTHAAQITDARGHAISWLGFLQRISHLIEDKQPKKYPTNFCLDCIPENLFAGGEKLRKLEITGRMTKYQQRLNLATVFCYAEGKNFLNEDAAFIQKLDMAQSEIVGHGNKISMIIDCSELKLPPNTLFYGLTTDFGKAINCESLEIVGLEQALNGKFDLTFEVKF